MPERRAAIVFDCLFPASAGGGERLYRRVAEDLQDRGFAVDYITRQHWDGPTPESRFAVVPVWRGEIYDPQGTRTVSSALRFACATYRHLVKRRGDYDLVIASALPVLTLIAARCALVGSKTRLVGDWLEVWRWRKWRDYSGSVLGTVAYVLQFVGLRSTHLHTCDSTFTSERARAMAPGMETLVLELVDLADRDGTMEPPVQPPYAIFVGRHIPDKQLGALPAAIRAARESVPTLECVVLGSGPDTPTLEQHIASEEMGDAFRVLGRVPDAQLSSFLAGAAVLVNPSRREGFGLVVAEASSFGVPSVVVAGEDNAAVDLIAEGRNGFVAPSASPADLGGAIARAVLAGRDLRASTAAWYAEARVTRSIRSSVDQLLERLDLTGEPG